MSSIPSSNGPPFKNIVYIIFRTFGLNGKVFEAFNDSLSYFVLPFDSVSLSR